MDFVRFQSVVLICARRVFHKDLGSEKLALSDESSQSLQEGAVIPALQTQRFFDLDRCWYPKHKQVHFSIAEWPQFRSLFLLRHHQPTKSILVG